MDHALQLSYAVTCHCAGMRCAIMPAAERMLLEADCLECFMLA